MKSMSHTSAPSSTDGSTRQFAKWLHQTLRYQGVQMRCRVRGNTLHLLYEGNPCPKKNVIAYHVLSQLNKTDINKRGSDSTLIYQVWLYGRSLHEQKPTWTFRINLDQLGHYLHHFTVRSRGRSAEPSSSNQLHSTETHAPPIEHEATVAKSSTASSGLDFAQLNVDAPATPPIVTAADSSEPSTQQIHDDKGDRPTTDLADPSVAPSPPVSSHPVTQPSITASVDQPSSIARELSETLSQLGVSVNVDVKTVSRSGRSAEVPSIRFPSLDTSHSKRLFVRCRAAYCPSSSLIADPIARTLRSLDLPEVQDAILSVCVNGEESPDWTLRIDLTPADILLQQWARWGDIEALSYLLNEALASTQVHITTASYQETALHLVCQPATDELTFPDMSSSSITAVVHPLLESLSPQGVRSVVLYGTLPSEDSPQWVEYLTLGDDTDTEDAHSVVAPLTLAEGGDLEAIAYLVSRLLNPALDNQLATGGIRVQLLQRDELLHIMCDAPTCPDREWVTTTVIRLLEQIRGTNFTGVRIYGRRSGARHPEWHDGRDFVSRSQIERQAPLDFVASDASYVNDLLDAPDESPLREDLTASELWTRWSSLRQRLMNQARRSLLKTQLVALTSDSPALALPSSIKTHGLKTAAVWAAVGVLSVVQIDWLMSQVPHPSDQSSPPSELTLTPATENEDRLTINRNGADLDISSASAEVSGSSIVSLISGSSAETLSAIQAQLLEQSPYPTFNSDQLDLKLALYYQRIAEFGTPDVLVIGSSRALRGIDPLILEETLADLGYENADVFNFGINGATAKVVELVVQHILVPEQLPKLILWADGARAFNGGREDRTYNGIAASEGYQLVSQGKLDIPVVTADNTPTDDGPLARPEDWLADVNQSITDSYDDLDDWLSQQLGRISMAHPNRDGIKAVIQDGLTGNAGLEAFIASGVGDAPMITEEADKMSDAAESESSDASTTTARMDGEIAPDGFLPLNTRFDPVTYYDQYEQVPGNYDLDYANFQLVGQQSDALQSLLQLGSDQDVPIVFINLPLTGEYLDPYRMSFEQEFRQHLLTLDLAHDSFIFRDLSELWLDGEEVDYHQYFSDPSHLNRYGAVEVSKRIAQDPMIPWAGTEF
jgi:hypothetical protein